MLRRQAPGTRSPSVRCWSIRDRMNRRATGGLVSEFRQSFACSCDWPARTCSIFGVWVALLCAAGHMTAAHGVRSNLIASFAPVCRGVLLQRTCRWCHAPPARSSSLSRRFGRRTRGATRADTSLSPTPNPSRSQCVLLLPDSFPFALCHSPLCVCVSAMVARAVNCLVVRWLSHLCAVPSCVMCAHPWLFDFSCELLLHIQLATSNDQQRYLLMTDPIWVSYRALTYATLPSLASPLCCACEQPRLESPVAACRALVVGAVCPV